MQLDATDLRASVRRAQLLLAAGGDTRRPLELEGRAVAAVAEDLDSVDARAQLRAGLAELAPAAAGLVAVETDRVRLLADSELAWRQFACATLASALSE